MSIKICPQVESTVKKAESDYSPKKGSFLFHECPLCGGYLDVLEIRLQIVIRWVRRSVYENMSINICKRWHYFFLHVDPI
jgi:hypothetical protein